MYGKNPSELYNNIQQATKYTRLIEIRLDCLYDANISLHIDVLGMLIKNFLDVDFIITCRMQQCGGNCENNYQNWTEVMKKAIELDFAYIDIDLELAKIDDLMHGLTNLRRNCGSKTQFIISYHNFTLTPECDELQILGDEMNNLDCDIQKFATTVDSIIDLQKLVTHLIHSTSQNKCVMVGMGDNEFAKKSRILSLLLGGEFSFFSLQGMTTASGQLTAQQGLEILEKLT